MVNLLLGQDGLNVIVIQRQILLKQSWEITMGFNQQYSDIQ